MIIWLNGAFGVGKTTVARELTSLLPRARVSDPERFGYVMKRTFWREHDYQEVPLWRRLARAQVAAAGWRRIAVVPMTLVDRNAFDELTSGATIFLLTASRSTLEHRIAGTDEGQAWRKRNLERCLDAFQPGGFGEPVDTDGRTPTEIARLILTRL